MQNLVDGNNIGAVRGIGCPDDYTIGQYSIALNVFSRASGDYSVAEGYNTSAGGGESHAEGYKTSASGGASHAEGSQSSASGVVSHAEGFGTVASGLSSHAECDSTAASAFASHAEGNYTVASGICSHTEGYYTGANNYDGIHIIGKFGDADTGWSWFLANGTDNANRGLAAKILGTGYAYIENSWVGGGADYAEMFETSDGLPVDAGYFVTIDGAGKKIRKANAGDDYILGVTSAIPVVLGDSGELRWKKKYLTDEWGRILYREVIIPDKKDPNNKVVIPQHKESQPLLNPDWDNTKKYIPRSKRPEWAAVGLLGKILVRDDGSCRPGSYCRPADGGIAAHSDKGYRVLERTGEYQILILFR